MFIYVIKARSIVYIFFAVLLLSAIIMTLIFETGSINVFSPHKELPIYSVEYHEKKVAITFDCAWGAEDIPDILSTLENENIKATFFIVGQWAEKYPDSVKMISDKGHDVANHSYSHLRLGALDRGRLKSEIAKCSEVLSQVSGKKVDLIRAPYGDYSNEVVNTARELGYYTIQWDVDSLDWKPGISRQEIMSRVMRKVKPGSIILFHNDTPYTAEVLPTIINSLKEKGYGFLPVSSLIIRENYIIDFEGRQKTKS